MANAEKKILRLRSIRGGFGYNFAAFVFILLFFGLKIMALDKSFQSLQRTNSNRKFHLIVVQPPKWMQAPLFHLPRVVATNYAAMKHKLKIYFYPYPANETVKFGFNPTEPLLYSNFSSKLYFFRNLHKTEMRTNNPNKAQFFVLPFSVFKLRMAIGPTKVSEFVSEYMQETVKRKCSHWNRTAGADHLHGTCHDLDVSTMSQALGLSASAIQIICPTSHWWRSYIPTKDFSFPQIWLHYNGEPGGLSPTER